MLTRLPRHFQSSVFKLLSLSSRQEVSLIRLLTSRPSHICKQTRAFADISQPQNRLPHGNPQVGGRRPPPLHHNPTTIQSPAALLNRRAERLVAEGRDILYTASSHYGYMYAGWFLGAMCFGGGFLMGQIGFYSAPEGLHWMVPMAYRFSTVFLAFLGGWAIARSSRRITSLQVRPGPEKPMITILVQRNTPIPFIKPRKIVVPLTDFQLGTRLVRPMGNPLDEATLREIYSGNKPRLARRFSMAMFRIFAGVRQYIFSDGLISVYLNGYNGVFRMDAHGHLRDDGQPLYELVSMRQD